MSNPEEIQLAKKKHQITQHLVHVGERALAISLLEKILLEFPNFAIAHNDLAVLILEGGEIERALKHYERAVELAPQNMTFKKNLGEYYWVVKKDAGRAVQIFLNIARQHPADAETLVALGSISLGTGQLESAEIFLSRAIELDPQNEAGRKMLEEIGRKKNSAASSRIIRERTSGGRKKKKNFWVPFSIDDNGLKKMPPVVFSPLLPGENPKEFANGCGMGFLGERDGKQEICRPSGKNLRNLKIAFIQANNDIDVQWFQPLAFGYLKANLERVLKKTTLFDLVQSMEQLENYDLVAISSTSQNYTKAKEIAREIKRRKSQTITVIGGHHVTYLPDTLTEDFDIGVIGEGEKTFGELVEAFQEKKCVLDPECFRDIKGIVYWESGKLRKTERRELIEPLDTLPHPARSSGESQYLFTSRGCPYHCSFCSSSAFWGKTRFFSAEYVVEEIEQILRMFPGIKQIPIWDDLFIANKPRLRKIIELLEAKGIPQKVTFSFSIRANLVDEEMTLALKRLNVIGVAFGAESGSDRILRLMNKGATTVENQRAIDLLSKHHIPVMCSFVVGWPSETEEEAKSTFEFILANYIAGKLPASNAINILMPIPGTPVWDMAIQEGLIDLNNFDWNRLSVFASYRDSRLKSFQEWVHNRKKRGSLYLAERTLPQERLYELMEKHYKLFAILENSDIRDLKRYSAAYLGA
jgi:radical SAM superfamily enzyme YgiQ (UPF0313 family)/Tfp pilus assembly protein PilF